MVYKAPFTLSQGSHNLCWLPDCALELFSAPGPLQLFSAPGPLHCSSTCLECFAFGSPQDGLLFTLRSEFKCHLLREVFPLISIPSFYSFSFLIVIIVCHFYVYLFILYLLLLECKHRMSLCLHDITPAPSSAWHLYHTQEMTDYSFWWDNIVKHCHKILFIFID